MTSMRIVTRLISLGSAIIVPNEINLVAGAAEIVITMRSAGRALSVISVEEMTKRYQGAAEEVL